MFNPDEGGYREDSKIAVKIYIGADHRGFHLKGKIIDYLTKKNFEVVDVGVSQENLQCDYPQFSKKVAEGVRKTKGSVGILVCLTGIGHSIAANKFAGIRAALCYNPIAAQFSRAHNDSNVLVLGATFTKPAELFEIIDVWLDTEFEGGRHARRVNQIKKFEKENFKKIR